MALVAREHGFWAHVGAGDQEQIKERVRAGVPVLIDLPIDTRKRNWRRLSLVVGFDDAQQRFLCHEGQGRPIRYTYEGLDRWWKHTRYWMMVICPPDRAAWSLRAEEYLSRGRYYESLNQLAEAEDDLDRAAEMNPSDSAVYVSLANVERKRGHRDEALAMYRKALDVREDDARAMNNLAYMLAEEDGGLAEAEALARNALLLEPTNPRTMDTLGVVQSRQGRHDKAAHFFEQAMARAGKLAAAERDEIAVHLAQAYRAGGRDAEAAKVVADLLRRNPDLRLPEDLRALHP
jgi:tetratricopeptide (TPR) repeat protein